MSKQIIKHGIDWLGLALFECPHCGCRFIENDPVGYYVSHDDTNGFSAWAWCPECGRKAKYSTSIAEKSSSPNMHVLDDYFAEKTGDDKK